MTTQQNPAATPGWYPVDENEERFWDGSTWTDQTRRSAPLTQAAAPTVATASGLSEGTPRAAWYKRTWVIAAGALLVGIGIGASSAGSADPKASPEYKALSSDLTQSQAATDQATSDLADAKAELETIAGDLPEREAAVEKAQADLEKSQADLAQAQADVKKADAAVTKREKAVGIVETEIANNTIAGDGIYQVGVDMKSGTYKMAGASCYYAVLGDANGNNILSNNNVDGPAIVSVQEGQFFESSGCDDWVLQR